MIKISLLIIPIFKITNFLPNGSHELYCNHIKGICSVHINKMRNALNNPALDISCDMSESIRCKAEKCEFRNGKESYLEELQQ